MLTGSNAHSMFFKPRKRPVRRIAVTRALEASHTELDSNIRPLAYGTILSVGWSAKGEKFKKSSTSLYL